MSKLTKEEAVKMISALADATYPETKYRNVIMKDAFKKNIGEILDRITDTRTVEVLEDAVKELKIKSLANESRQSGDKFNQAIGETNAYHKILSLFKKKKGEG